MRNQFGVAPQANISRSTFNRSHGLKTTFDSGLLVPFLVDEVLPGDDVTCRLSALVRMATPIHPVMDNLYLDTFFFFVPNRLVWDNWQKFMGEQDNPGDSTDFTVPARQLTGSAGDAGIGSLQDYFGLPVVGHTGNFTVSDLPFRCYNLIWNEWFRDENLQNSAVVDKGDTVTTVTNYVLRRRGKRRDYLTSSLPFPQKGPGVDLPLGTTAPVTTGASVGEPIGIRNIPEQLPFEMNSDGAGTTVRRGTTATTSAQGMVADLANATAATINDLRMAFQIQKLQERDARGGTRYTEILKSHFGVVSPDARLQRPEFLGSGTTPVNVTQVPQTGRTETDSTPENPKTPQGNLAGYATASVRNNGFTKGFVEHGWILGLMSVRADLTYQRGVEKMWSRSTKYDFYWPALQGLGEQAVLNQEIWVDGTSADQQVWGYQSRWSEYRFKYSKITGQFRSGHPNTLDPWHLSQDFENRPVLNDSFIQDTPPVKRVIAVTSEPEFIFDGWIDYKWARPLPVHGIPGYIDHF